jgi:hypothetical protein
VFLVPDRAGSYQMFVPPGRHLLRVCGGGAAQRSVPLSSGGAIFVAELPLDVPAGPDLLERTLMLSTTALAVVAGDGGHQPVPQLKFTLEGRTTYGDCETKFEFVPGDGATGVLPEVPPGKWVLTADSPRFDAEPQLVEVPPGEATLAFFTKSTSVMSANRSPRRFRR